MPEPTAQELELVLAARLGEALGCPPETLDPTAPFERLGLESVEATRLIEELGSELGRELDITLVWEHPTIERLAAFLATAAADPASSPGDVAPNSREPLAIIGVGCRLPGADSLAQLRELLLEGRDATGPVPAERWEAEAFRGSPGEPGRIASSRGAFIEAIDRFDAQFFGISPREAAQMDPQQRIALEVAWEAMENASVVPERLAGSRTAVMVGIGSSDYAQLGLKHGGELAVDAYAATGNAHSIASNRLSYLLDLRGPSLSVDTACSSSLVALHLASRSLLAGESDLALVGAVNLLLAPEASIAFSDARMLAPDGRCKTFDESADGYGRGEGCAFAVLKRLSDAERDGDRAIALLHGTAVNQDGLTNGLTAPNGRAQQEVIRAALAEAGLQPEQVGYVEAHGTGTPLGDPIEVRALAAVYGRTRRAPDVCAIGSAKANLGHLEAAAGMAGLLKAILSVSRGELYPQPNLRQLNRNIELAEAGLAIPTRAAEWRSEERFAGVSSFGFGGTNAHVVVGSPPATASPPSLPERPHLLVLSAKHPSALAELAARTADRLDGADREEVAEACCAAACGRQHMEHRLGLVAGSGEELVSRLRGDPRLTGSRPRATAGDRSREVAFLFSGQGSQYPGMGSGLYAREPAFREAIDRADETLAPLLGRPLIELLGDSDERLHTATRYAQPLLVALQLALLDLWASWGVRPSCVLGHSVGELSAAVAAGALAREDALRLASERGRLMEELPAPGMMLAVFGDPSVARELIERAGADVCLAGVNGPEALTAAGSTAAIERLEESLRGNGLVVRSLRVSGAFHSPLMEPAVEPLRQFAASIPHRDLQIPFVSTLSGEELGSQTRLDEDYWARQLRSPVLFAPAIAHLHERGYRTYLELGPHTTLSTLGRNAVADPEAEWLASLDSREEDGERVLNSLVHLHVNGARVDWTGVFGARRRHSSLLPRYPFQRRRHWLEETEAAPAMASRSRHPQLGQRLATVHEAYRLTLPAGDPGDAGAGTCVELALAAVAESSITGPCTLAALSCRRPLRPQAGRVPAEASLLPIDGDRRRFALHARPAEGGAVADWQLYASAEVLADPPAVTSQAAERARLLRDGGTPAPGRIGEGISVSVAAGGGREALVVPAPGIELGERRGYTRLIGSAIAVAGSLWGEGEPRVPASIGRVAVVEPAGTVAQLLLRLAPDRLLETVGLDDEGQALVEILAIHAVEAPRHPDPSSVEAPAGDGSPPRELDRSVLLAASASERRSLLTEQLIGMISELLDWPAEELDPDTQLATLGIDSLRLLEARNLIAERLGLEVDFDTLAAEGTPDELARLLLDELELLPTSEAPAP